MTVDAKVDPMAMCVDCRLLFLGPWLKALAAGLELGAEVVQWGMG